jgi:hypothetical protein
MTSEGRSQESRRVAFQRRFRSEFVFGNNSPLFSLHFILSEGIDREVREEWRSGGVGVSAVLFR